MKGLVYIFFFFFLFPSFSAVAQNQDPGDSTAYNTNYFNGGCNMDAFLGSARETSSFKIREAKMNRNILSGPVVLGADFTLPVVFHIIADDPSLTTDQEINDALTDLNDAFGKTGPYSVSLGADTKIRFCLAKKDPDGGITNGITRTVSFFGNDLNKSIEDTRLKNLISWNPEHYINIWYVRNIYDENFVFFTCSQWRRIGTEGYATMPARQGDSTDGIVVSKFGPVLAHEMGHYLGLYHTFEGGCNNRDCQLNGDRVCDTPPDNTYMPSSCINPGNTCGTDTFSNYSNGSFPIDVPDQVTNFMDYGNFNCSNEFTEGQAVRMRSAIATLRSALLQNKCNKPCSDNIIAGFTRDNPYPQPGSTIQFTNTSSGANKFEWLINDSLVNTGTDLSFTFHDPGKYKLTLKAYNQVSCYGTSTDYIIVNCGVTARFYPDKRRIASKIGFITDSIFFTNTSENATSFKWLMSNDDGMDEQVVSTSKNLLYTFPSPGNYGVRLIASNGNCTDSTETFRIPVLDPTPDGRPRITQIDCYDQTKIRVSFGICNSGYTPIPPGTPVTFYDGDPTNAGARKIGASFLLPDTIYGFCCSAIYTEIVDVSKPKLNSLYLVFNDRGNEIPIKLPNTSFIEKNYDNNIISKTGFGYNVTIDPPEVVLEPGDTIQLTATALPNSASSEYRWSPTDDLSCSDCPNPILTADSNTQKQVISKSEYGCTDTAIVDIKVPPVNDYTISLDQVQCMAKEDSLVVNFTVKNSYKRPVLPKGLAVAFYNVNPVNAEAALLYSVFKLPATLNQAQASFASGMKGVKEGELFAVVNDNGTTIPLKLPNTDLLETNYSNNTGSIIHEKITVKVSNSSPVCENDSVQLMAVSSVDGANFEWSGPGGFKSSSQNAWLTNITASNAGAYSAIASKNGCASDSAATSVVVNAAPVVIAAAKEPVCETKSLALTASSVNAASYSWTGPGGFTSTDQNPVITPVTFAASGTYHVTATGNNKCISQAVPVQVKVNPLPVPAFTAPEICLPSTTVQFKNESTISQGSINSWLWNFGDPLSGESNIDSVRHPVHKFSNAGKYSVTLKAVSSEGCMASTSLLYAGIHKQPVASFTNDHPNGVCVNDPVIFTDKSIGDEGTITKWTWQTGDGSPAIIQHTTATPVKHVYTKDGTYTVSLTVTNDFGCENNTAGDVKVFPLPTVDAGQDIYIPDGSSTNLRSTATGNNISYLWSPPTYLSSTTISNPSVNRPVDDILYLLTVTSQDGCKASDQVMVKILRKIKIPNAFSPNRDGINDVWNIAYLNDYPGSIVEIFDRYGKLVFRSIGYSKPWDGTRNGMPMPVGVYYYIITPNNGVERTTGSVTVLR